MDAVDSKRAALFGISEGGPMSLLFAATYPERVSALVLYGSYARHPTLTDENFLKQQIESVDRLWGTGEFLKRHFVPDHVVTDLPLLARIERQAASPSAVAAIMRMNSEVDARHILPMVHAPTLVLHRSGDTRMSIDAGRYVANNVPGAKMVTLSGQNHMFIYEPEIIDRIADEVEEFLTGSRREIETDRVLATVMFTDIVESTKRAAKLGDRQWSILVDNHDKMVREQLARFRGCAIKTLGDGFLATFDGPARAVRCASSIVESVYSLGIDVRIGIHTGEVELKGNDIGGIAVNIAARVAGIAGPGSTLVSSTVRDLVAGSRLRFEDRGRHALKGLPEDVHVYAVLHGA
jgi:class 3 adenylate cyclase